MPIYGDWASKNYVGAQILDPPDMYGLISMNYNPDNSTGTQLLTAGTLYVVKRYCPPATITGACIQVTTAGATLTSGQNFIGLWDYATSGAQRAISASQHTAWQTSNSNTINFVTPYVFAGGYIYVGFYSNGTTQPTLGRAVSGTVQANPNHVATLPAVGTANTGLTATPPATLGVMSNTTAIAFWVGLAGTVNA